MNGEMMKYRFLKIGLPLTIAAIFVLIVTKGCSVDRSNTKIQPESDQVLHNIKVSKFDPDSSMISGSISEGDGLTSALLKIPGVKMEHVIMLTNALMEQMDFRMLKIGQKFKLKLSDDGKNVDKFIFNQDIVNYFVVQPDSSGVLYCEEKKLPTTKKTRIIDGCLLTSLDAALGSSEIPMALRQTVNNILECTVAFQTDARKGDLFKLYVEEEFYEDSIFVGGKVLYASYLGFKTGLHEGFYYEESDPKSAFNSHYTKDGRALVNSGLRIPIDRVHVTSTFGYRMHPITGVNTMHNGVDYAGRIGDAVYAACAGRVKDACVTALGGKQISIMHADGTETYYLHLSRFNVKKGQVVKSRQVIGAVGNTGRSTGPHLHFGIKQKSSWLNPLSKHMIATPKLDGAKFEALQNRITEIGREIAQKSIVAAIDKRLQSIVSIDWLEQNCQGFMVGVSNKSL